ncbi:MAG TPA: hypothetical protein VMP11_08655 [Verrucomicrobiae bacterium]|nr:hypothetical protein [Verrucomicrobiae bacterium]
MKSRLSGIVLCAALLGLALGSGRAIAADAPNKFDQAKKHDIEFTGSITAIDTNAPSVTVNSKEKGPMTLSVASDCMFFVKHKKGAAALSDFKVGEEVHVLYKQSGSAMVCDSMWEPGSNAAEKEHKVQKGSSGQ